MKTPWTETSRTLICQDYIKSGLNVGLRRNKFYVDLKSLIYVKEVYLFCFYVSDTEIDTNFAHTFYSYVDELIAG